MSKNINKMIQVMLKEKGYYSGELDGTINSETFSGIEKLLESYSILSSRWNSKRKIIGASQILYLEAKLKPGPVDGFMGPSTQQARTEYLALLSSKWRNAANKVIAVEKPSIIVPKTTGLIKPMRNWPHQSRSMSYYGNPGTNQATCKLPFTMVIAWNTKQKVNSYRCHKYVKDPMERIWNRTLEHYGLANIQRLRLNYFGGCLNVRKVRGGSSWSQHSWGIAVDIDPDRNQLRWGRNKASLARPEYDKFWQFVYDEGAISFGKERNYDWMHFQFAKL